MRKRKAMPVLLTVLALLLAPLPSAAAGPVSPAPAFADLQGHWAAGSVAEATALGLISGYPDGRFRPDQPVTRAEFVKLVVQGRRLTPAPGTGGFADVAEHWLVQDGYLQAATDAGLVVPTDFGDPPRLEPDRPITRQEVAVIAARFLHKQAAAMVLRGAPLPYVEAIDGWASGALAVATSAGILQGYPDGAFGPGLPLTRAEAAAVAVRLVRMAVAEGSLAAPPASQAPRAVPVWEANAWQVSTLSGLPVPDQPGPSSLAAGPDGSLYLTDGRGLWQVTPPGAARRVYAGAGLGAVAVAGDGTLYTAAGNRVLRIAAGQGTAWAGSEEAFFADGSAAQARFSGIRALCAGAAGDLFVLEGGPRLRRIDPAGNVSTVAGLTPLAFDDLLLRISAGPNEGGAAEGYGRLTSLPGGAMTCDAAGNVYLGGQDIVRVSPSGQVTWLAGNQRVAGYADGLAAEAQFAQITGLAVDRWGDLWIADGGNQRLRRLTPDGHVYTVAGGGERRAEPRPTHGYDLVYAAGDRDGPGPDARFQYPQGLALAGGSLFVAQSGGAPLRRIDGLATPYADGQTVAAVVGPGLAPGATLTGQTAPGPVTVDLALYAPVLRVKLSVDGAPVATGGDPVYTMGWDATAAAPGAHSLTLQAERPGGGWQVGAAGTVQIGPGLAPPLPYSGDAHAALLAPGSGSWLQGVVTVTAATDGTPTQLRLDGETLAAGSDRLLTATWDTTTVADGAHRLAVGWGEAGGSMRWRESTVQVINGGPPALPDEAELLRVVIAGQRHDYGSVQPRLVDGEPWLPFTETMEACGFWVNWDGATHTLLAWRSDSPFRLTLHEDTGAVAAPAGDFRLPRPPLSVHNNLLVPATLFAAIGHAPQYDAAQRTVTLP